MEILYNNRALEKKCNENAIKVYGPLVGKEIYKVIQALEAASSLNDIRVQKRFRLHPLNGNRNGEYSITITKNSGLRLIIVPLDDKIEIKLINYEKVNVIKIKEVVDYHG